MKRIFIIILFIVLNKSLIGQIENDTIIKSLDFLDRELHIHFNKMKAPILINTNKRIYFCSRYIDALDKPLNEVYLQLNLELINDSTMFFELRVSDKYEGTFKIKSRRGELHFSKLEYRTIAGPYISLPKKSQERLKKRFFQHRKKH